MSIQYVVERFTSLKLNFMSISSSNDSMRDIYLLWTVSSFLLFFMSPLVVPRSEMLDWLLDLLMIVPAELSLLLNALIAYLYFMIDLLFELVLLLMLRISYMWLMYSWHILRDIMPSSTFKARRRAVMEMSFNYLLFISRLANNKYLSM